MTWVNEYLRVRRNKLECVRAHWRRARKYWRKR